MAIRVTTDDPAALLKAIQKAIGSGHVKTWSIGNGYFNHQTAQWKGKAYVIGQGQLTFNIIRPKGRSIDTPTYAAYHGHFVEMLLNHFDSEFALACSSALPTPRDLV
jgi:hypothetical protein